MNQMNPNFLYLVNLVHLVIIKTLKGTCFIVNKTLKH